MKLQLLSSLVLFAPVSAKVISLTPENYESITDGKTVFIKYFAPWCGHCKKLAPDWEKLAEDWEGHEHGLIAEVDCTSEGKALCQDVKGFPTLKYGDPMSPEDYSGGRSFDALSAFAKENLKPICSPGNLDLCDDENKALIEKYMAMSQAEIEKLIIEAEMSLTDVEQEFQAEVKKLQERYQKLDTERKEKEAKIKGSGLGMMKSVKNHNSKGHDEL